MQKWWLRFIIQKSLSIVHARTLIPLNQCCIIRTLALFFLICKLVKICHENPLWLIGFVGNDPDRSCTLIGWKFRKRYWSCPSTLLRNHPQTPQLASRLKNCLARSSALLSLKRGEQMSMLPEKQELERSCLRSYSFPLVRRILECFQNPWKGNPARLYPAG